MPTDNTPGQIKVCQITTVHPSGDTRIFLKECTSLAAAGFTVILLVVNARDEFKNGVRIKGVEVKFSSRLARFRNANRKIFRAALAEDADVYHFHDPEFLPWATKLVKKGKKVIYDVHEDLPRQLLSKFWIPAPLRKSLSVFTEIFENHYSRKMTHIITATDFIRDRFLIINTAVTSVKNFPILPEQPVELSFSKKRNEVCYVGSIARVRGITELIDALALCKNDIRLNLAGKFSPPSLREEVMKSAGWEKVNEIGFANRDKIAELLDKSFAGMVTLHPIINYLDALPVKLFEYMSAGVPVIASNFPLWEEIVNDADCGLCVDPLNPGAIANAIDFLFENHKKAEAYGVNGQKTVYQKYTWKEEEQKLLKIYSSLS